MENRDLVPSVEPPLPEQVAPLPPPSTTALSSLPHATALSSLPYTTALSSRLQELQFGYASEMENRDPVPSVEPPLPEQVAPPPPPSTTALSSLPHTTALSSRLQELQNLWLEIGESDNESVRMKEELELKCLDIYNKKIEEARKCKAELQRSLAEAEDEITCLMSSLGEQVPFSWKEGSLKHRISTVKPVLEDLRMRKELKSKEFSGTLTQTAEMSSYIPGNDHPGNSGNLTQLQYLPDEKAVKSSISAIHELSTIMLFDPYEALTNVHASLTGSSKNISDDTFTKLRELVEFWKKEKHRRLTQLEALVRIMSELWEQLNTPMDERRTFEVDAPGGLSLNVVQEAEAEVGNLNALKESMMLVRINTVFDTAHQLLPGEQVVVPGEQLAPIAKRDRQGSSGNNQELDEAELSLFMKQARKQLEVMKEQLKNVGAKKALGLLEEIWVLFASFYSLPEMEEYIVSTHGLKYVGMVRNFFTLVVQSEGVEQSGFAAYERHSLESARQRRDKKETEQRSSISIEEQTGQSGSGASTSGR